MVKVVKIESPSYPRAWLNPCERIYFKFSRCTVKIAFAVLDSPPCLALSIGNIPARLNPFPGSLFFPQPRPGAGLLLARLFAGIVRHQRLKKRLKPRQSPRICLNLSAYIRYATALRRISFRAAPISGQFKTCWGTATSIPP